MTIVLGILAVLVAWLLISGMEGRRERAVFDRAASPGQGAVLVIGGTRATGLEIVKVLRARGDEVVVLAREGSDATAAERLGARIVRGDAMKPADLAAAFAASGSGKGYRAVVSTLGGRSVDGERPDFEGNRNAIDAARAGVRRFVLVTVIGAGESFKAAPWLSRRFLAKVMEAKTRAEDYLKASGLDYTVIRPGGLLDGEPEGQSYLTGDARAMSWIRRSDLALLAVQALDDRRAAGEVYHAFDPNRTRFWAMFIK